MRVIIDTRFEKPKRHLGIRLHFKPSTWKWGTKDNSTSMHLGFVEITAFERDYLNKWNFQTSITFGDYRSWRIGIHPISRWRFSHEKDDYSTNIWVGCVWIFSTMSQRAV